MYSQSSTLSFFLLCQLAGWLAGKHTEKLYYRIVYGWFSLHSLLELDGMAVIVSIHTPRIYTLYFFVSLISISHMNMKDKLFQMKIKKKSFFQNQKRILFPNRSSRTKTKKEKCGSGWCVTNEGDKMVRDLFFPPTYFFLCNSPYYWVSKKHSKVIIKSIAEE